MIVAVDEGAVVGDALLAHGQITGIHKLAYLTLLHLTAPQKGSKGDKKQDSIHLEQAEADACAAISISNWRVHGSAVNQ
jgi:hypothetical protein